MTLRLVHLSLFVVSFMLACAQTGLSISVAKDLRRFLTWEERRDFTSYIMYWLLMAVALQGIFYILFITFFNRVIHVRKCFVGASSETIFFAVVFIEQVVFTALISRDAKLFEILRSLDLEGLPVERTPKIYIGLMVVAWLWVAVLLANILVVVLDAIKRGSGYRIWALPFGVPDDDSRTLPAKYEKYERRGPHAATMRGHGGHPEHGMAHRLGSNGSEGETDLSYKPTKSTM